MASLVAFVSAGTLAIAPPALASSQATVTNYSVEGPAAPNGVAVIQSGDDAGKVWVSADIGGSTTPNSLVYLGPGGDSADFDITGSVPESSYPQAVVATSTGTALIPSGSNFFDKLYQIDTEGSTTSLATQDDSVDIVLGNTDDVVYLLGQDGRVERLDITGPTSSRSAPIANRWNLAYSSSNGRVAVSKYSDDQVAVLNSDLSLRATYDVGNDPRGLVFDSAGNLYVANFSDESVSQVAADGTVTVDYAQLPGKSPWDIAVDSEDALYVADLFGGVSRITNEGAVKLDWGPQDQSGTVLRSIDVGPDGSVWAANEGAMKVQKFTPPADALPAAPSNVAATPGDGSITLTWDPAYDNGDPIDEYQYSFTGTSGWTKLADPGANEGTITGLNNGQTYNIYIRAKNGVGGGPYPPDAPVQATPAEAPSAPTSLSASPGDGEASITFTAGSNGGSAITNYKYELDGGGSWTALDPADSSSPVTIPNLTNGTEYSIRLRAVNEIGDGGISDAVTVTPLGTPAAPTDLNASGQDQAASISFTARSDGGSPILDYEYQLDGGEWKPAGTTSSPVVIDGLMNGTTYSVKIRATNAIGDGKGTASSAVTVTPVSSSDPPGAPASLEALPGGSTLDLSWEAPNPGGAPISDYEYKTDSDPWLSLGTTNSTVTITTDSAGVNLDPATAYSVQIRAVNANGPGDPSASVTQTPGVPLAPQNPSSAWSADSLALSWSAATANGDPVTEYRIVVSQLSQRSGFRMLRSGPGTYTTTSTSFTVSGLSPAPTYTITLTARNGRGWGVPTSFTVAGTGQVEENRQTPAPIIQQVGLPISGTCDDVIDGMFGAQTFIQGGWGQSWARWMNNGLGGAVCTRTLAYSNAQGRWTLAEY